MATTTSFPLDCAALALWAYVDGKGCNGTASERTEWRSRLVKRALAVMPRNNGASRKQNEATKILTQKRALLLGSYTPLQWPTALLLSPFQWHEMLPPKLPSQCMESGHARGLNKWARSRPLALGPTILCPGRTRAFHAFCAKLLTFEH